MMAGAVAMVVGSTATVTMLMPAIDVVTVHWAGGLGGQQRQQRRDREQRQRQCRHGSGRVRVQFLGGRATLTLRGAFRKDDTDDDDDGDK